MNPIHYFLRYSSSYILLNFDLKKMLNIFYQKKMNLFAPYSPLLSLIMKKSFKFLFISFKVPSLTITHSIKELNSST